ncbi:MAG: uroporphyrinogen-III synthase [Saprospiraceae bacterium]|nr:uroporphyrinogen-III synthase [Saprospiraceae bacterium]
MTQSVFISRDLSASSDFAGRLRAVGYVVTGFSLVLLRPLPIAKIPPADWLFFASRHAVQFFFEQTPAQAGVSGKIAALGPATAAEIRRYTGRVDFSGSGDPAATARAFAVVAAGQTVLFPAALHSQKSISQALGNSIRALHLPVYENTALPDPPLLEQTVLVFTSPLNARAYFARHRLLPGQKLVAIGQTTGEALVALGFSEVKIAGAASELAMADAVLSLR